MRYYFLLLFGVTSTTLNVVNPNIQIWQDDDPLAGIDIKPETVEIPYDRDSYSYGIDADKDGQDTRAELLLKSSITNVSFKDAKKHIVSSGKWFDPYTGVTFYNADHVDIDHLVPLYEVHLSGGAFWSNEKKRAFSNDISDGGPLRITHRWTNRIPKGRMIQRNIHRLMFQDGAPI